MRPLDTIESMTGCALFTAARASSPLPEAPASVALRMAVRRRERSATLAVRCLMACRAAFSADFVFATLDYSAVLQARLSGPRSVCRRQGEVNRKAVKSVQNPGVGPSCGEGFC